MVEDHGVRRVLANLALSQGSSEHIEVSSPAYKRSHVEGDVEFANPLEDRPSKGHIRPSANRAHKEW
jgi:hypothetical protein